MGCHSLLQGIFPTQGLNLGLLHCRQILYCLSHLGSPRLGSPKSKPSGKDLSANGTFGRGFQEKSGSETGKGRHSKGGVINQVTRGQVELFTTLLGARVEREFSHLRGPGDWYQITKPHPWFVDGYVYTSCEIFSFRTVVKNLRAMQDMWVPSLGLEDLEKEMATHSSMLAWGIPWTEEPGGLLSMGVTKGLDMTSATKQQLGRVQVCFCRQKKSPQVENGRCSEHAVLHM